MGKTIREALDYVQYCLDKGDDISKMMGRQMIESIIVNLEEGKGINDTIDFN